MNNNNLAMLALICGAFLGIGGYPIFLMQRKRIGAVFGLVAGLWILANLKTKLPEQQSLIVLGLSGLFGAVLFYGSITMMNHGVSFILGAMLTHQIYTIIFKQLPSPVIVVVVAVLCAVGASILQIPFVMGVVAVAGALLLVVGLEALFFPNLVVSSPVSIIAINLSPVQNIIFILIFLGLCVACFFSQFYLLRSLIRGR